MDVNAHLERVINGANNVYNLENLPSWIEKFTFVNDKPFNFVGREYQRDILLDPSHNVFCAKAAQTGLTEVFGRWVVAASCTQKDFTIIWTFPSTSDAERFTKARLDPMIAASQEATRHISRVIDSVELKQFGRNNFVYIRGTLSDTGGLSVPADALIHDEFDRSDMDNISQYVSRLQMKPTKKRKIFSTPTVAKYGISKLAETSRRKHQMWKCTHCNHSFIPNYEQDVHIPGYLGDKKLINKANLPQINYTEARVLCPKCLKVADHSIENREWVVENNSAQFEDVTYYVSPFCAPDFLTAPYLVKASTEFDKWSEFCNQALGITAEDSKETLTEADVRKAITTHALDSSEVHYFGADMGLVCHVTISRRTSDGQFLVVHRERVLMGNFVSRRAELVKQYRCIVTVIDTYPYTDIVKTICDYDTNAWGAVFVPRNSTENYVLKDYDGDEEEGKLPLRQAQINREVAFDSLMEEFKKDKVVIAPTAHDEEFVTQMTSMKRIKVYDKHGQERYKWQKTDGNDHYHNSMLYSYIAASLRGTVLPEAMGASTALVVAMKVKKRV